LNVCPPVERLFGIWGFAVLYLLSSLGGSTSSLWYHPMVVSAGDPSLWAAFVLSGDRR
jgi:hypothetical protein